MIRRVLITLATIAVTASAAIAGQSTPASVAKAQADLRVYRPATPGTSLDDRWRWALAEARRQGLSRFWIAYSFETPVYGDDLVISDSNGNSFVSSHGRLQTAGPPLTEVLRDGGGNIVVLLQYRGTADTDIDRAAYRSARLGFDFERMPLFWLGYADEAQSFARVRGLFERSRVEKIQTRLIELASVHGNSNVVIPFLAGLVEPSRPAPIRTEAAEGFSHHHDRRSVEILLRVARTDPLSEVRAEAAETIGEVQTPQSIPALIDLIEHSDDPAVRGEAAEAFAEQPAEHAVPAIERVVAASRFQDVLSEAVEALGEIDHGSALEALVRIARTDAREQVQADAIEAITDVSDGTLHPVILDLAASGKTPRVRRDAIEAIGDAVSETGDAQVLDRAEQALARAIFDDPDTSVKIEALDSLEKLPRDRELRVLRQVIDKHPDNRVRREAGDHLRDRRQ